MFKFFSSFTELSEIPLNKNKNTIQFSKEKTFESVIQISERLHHKVIKPQRLLHDEDDYYIAVDQMTNTFYICYKNLLMLDIDLGKCKYTNFEEILSELKNYCEKDKNIRFRLFKTRKGVHAFLVSKPMEYRSIASIEMMISLDVDFFYVIFTYLRGWCVRLNRKRDEPIGKEIYEKLEDIGYGEIDEHLNKLVDLHINLLPVFINEQHTLQS